MECVCAQKLSDLSTSDPWLFTRRVLSIAPMLLRTRPRFFFFSSIWYKLPYCPNDMTFKRWSAGLMRQAAEDRHEAVEAEATTPEAARHTNKAATEKAAAAGTASSGGGGNGAGSAKPTIIDRSRTHPCRHTGRPCRRTAPRSKRGRRDDDGPEASTERAPGKRTKPVEAPPRAARSVPECRRGSSSARRAGCSAGTRLTRRRHV